MTLRTVTTVPVEGQRPGTSGLRKKTRVFMQPGYLENFIQSAFNALLEDPSVQFAKETLVVGGDGRFYNRAAVQTIVRMAAGNGFGNVLLARGGLLSTPAMSAVIRRRGALGGFILSASHNPGGIDEDFGVKYNARNGGPAPEALTERIYKNTGIITGYRIVDQPDIDLDFDGGVVVGMTKVTVFDPLEDYTAVMQQLFDFVQLRHLFRGGFRMVFDGMHGITGPYAHHILEDLLEAPKGTVMNGTPLEDFGGHHPDPNLVHAAELVRMMNGPGAPDFGAACDGDGDRNLILGSNFFVTPGDSLAVIAEHAQTAIPGYRGGLAGIARSMPTSTAADRVAAELNIPIYETPTGWKFFGNLMDAGLCTVCGEESFGTGSNHVREKDGLWAVLAWLSILAAIGKSVSEVVHRHWAKFGRSYFQRHDYEALDLAAATRMLDEVRAKLPRLAGLPFAESVIDWADDFSYSDPVDGSVTSKQGIRLFLANRSRVVFRLSGTGTQGATLRIYLERFDRDSFDEDPNAALSPMAEAVKSLIGIREHCHRDTPDVIT